MIDSGATHHITPNCSDFIDWTPASGTVSLGGCAEIRQVGTGSVILAPLGGYRPIHLHNVMHVPDATARYFSVSALVKKGGQISFDRNKLQISLRGRKVAEGYHDNNLFWIDTSRASLNAIRSTPTSLDLWHKRMGHMSPYTLPDHADSVKRIHLSHMDKVDHSPCASC